VFEAAARHNSFRKAADELNLTASAISHGVQSLENWLGTELFYREARGLRLTNAGEIYARSVNEALGVIAKATEQVPGRAATGTLSVSIAPSFGSRILLPRLEKFIAQFPNILVTIDTSHRPVDLTIDDVDVAIRIAPTESAATNWTLLATETVTPVCSPSLKKKLESSSKTNPLFDAPLIHVTSVSVDWQQWFRTTGREYSASIKGGLRVDTIQMAFEAAKRGLGVVLGRTPLVDEEIANGRLVPLVSEAIPSGNGYWLVTSQTEFQKPEVKSFKRWLVSELAVNSEERRFERRSESAVQKTKR